MSEWKEQVGEETIIRTCAWSPPGDHPVGCGMFLHVKDGKLVKVEGDPNHPITKGRLCPRCLAMDEFTYSPDRILHPMKRDPKDRGKDAWTETTWDEALDMIEEHWLHIKENWGTEAIVVFQGTGRESTLYAGALAQACLLTMNQCFSMSGLSCYGPRCLVADFVLGAGYPELDYAAFFPDRYDDPRYEIPKYILIWGKNPIYSSGDGFFGHAVVDLMKRGTKLIVVDPRVTWLAVRAEYHVQLRPGTDAAVALGFLNVVINEDLYDHEFVDKWCFGFDALKERVQEYPPEKVAEIAWIDKDVLIGAARAFATNSPSSLLWGLAMDTAQNGVQGGQAVLDLVAICGYYDIPGGVTLAKPTSFMGQWRIDCVVEVPKDVQEKRIGRAEYKSFRAGGPAHPDVILEQMESGQPYPLKMLWFFGTNPMANTCWAQPKRWEKAVSQLEFNVVQDCFMTPTAMALCDLFLPLSGSAEHDGVVLPHFGRNTHFLGAMNTAFKVGDTKSDIEICIWLGKRLNPKAWPWNNAAEFFSDQIKSTGVSFEELQDIAYMQQPFEYRKYEKGMLREDGQPGFNTSTGLIELKSNMYKMFDDDPVPYFQEPFYSPYSDQISDEMKQEFPLVLTTGGRNILYFHSEHRQIPSLRGLSPDPIVTINPETAKRYGIKNGDWVAIENPEGRCVERARVSEEIKDGVIHAEHGWWFPEQDGEAPNLFGVYKSSVNSLIPHHKVGVMGQGANYKSVICKIYPVATLDD